MPMVEVDEEDLRKNTQLRTTLTAIMANPESRKKLLEAHKIVNPTAPVPELEQSAKLDGAIGELKKTVTDFISEQKQTKATETAQAEQAKIEDRIQRGFKKLRESGVTDDGIKEVEKLMQAEGIVNPEVAWSHFEKLNPSPPVTTPGSVGPWNFLQPQPNAGEDITKLIESRGENNAILDRMTQEALTAVRGR